MATDDDGTTFSHLCGGDDDESSLDIYGDLDSTPVASDNTSSKVTPTRSNLNLFDEILIEEGAAKQATYNDLQTEYEKCQQQLQELMKKLQEIQEQNSTLQNENQSLKKNISALIKTARVEINRKDEEINTLQRRLSGIPICRNTHSGTYFPPSTHHAKNTGGSKSKNKFGDLLPEGNKAIDSRSKPTPLKDIADILPSKEADNKKCHAEKGVVPYVPQSDPEESYHDDAHARLANADSSSEKEKCKKEIKHSEHQNRDNDFKYKMKAQQTPESTAEGILNGCGKLQVNSEKTVRNGLWKDSKDVNNNCSPCTEKRTDKIPPARDKQPSSKDRLSLKTGPCGDDRAKKSQNINQKDLNMQSKEESNSALKNKRAERYLDQQRTMFANPPERKAKSPQKLSKSCVEEKKIKDSDCRRNKGGSNHGIYEGRFSEVSPPNREQKHGHPKESSKYESLHSKSDRHRTEEKRKNERNSQREGKGSQSGRREPKDTSQKPARKFSKDKHSSKEEEEKSLQPEKLSKSVSDREEQMSTKAGRAAELSKSKDLKLSFMQTLNLTLSPAKKQTDRSVAKSSKICEAEVPSQKALLVASKEKGTNADQLCASAVPAESVNTHTTKQTQMPLLASHTNPALVNIEKGTTAPKVTPVENEGLAKALSTEPRKTTSSTQNTARQGEPAQNGKPSANAEKEAGNKMYAAGSPGSPVDPDSSFGDLEIITSVDFDSFRVIDEIHGSDSDSSMEEEGSSNCTNDNNNNMLVCLKKENKPVSHTSTMCKGKILSDEVAVVNQRTHNRKPSFPEVGNHREPLYNQGSTPTSHSRDTSPVFVDDDSSILSIDLNQMRCIPKVISPLNSPIRPLAKVLRMESPYKGPVKSFNTDFVPGGAVVCPGRNQSHDLNKENEKPLCTDHQVLEVSQLNMSSDELEEGEIVSDIDEPKIEQNSENSKKSKRKSPNRSNFPKSTCSHKAKSTASIESAGKLAHGKKGKEKPQDGSVMSSKEVKKTKTVSIDYLERIVQITSEPATIHEFMHMLKAIRKHLHKNYMKFKIQFPEQHFHRFIDSAVVNFTSLVKYLNFCKMSKSSEALKLNLCEVIESKLNHVKKNSAIEHLFKLQQSDMKKKLWKLMDEQLDYLFDKIKKILLKLCSLVKIGKESDETKLDKRMKEKTKCLVRHKNERQKSKKPALNTRTQKPIIGNQLSKRDYHVMNEMDTHKNTATKCKYSSTNNTKHTQTKVELFKEKSMQDTTVKDGKYEKEELHVVGDPQKSDVSCGPLTEQQMSGLTFNLVNDAQMGEMFKSLLQGSDLSEKNVDFTDEHQWEFRTPEKHTAEGHNCEDDPAYEAEESVQKDTQLESRVLDSIKWPIVSPERDSPFLARLPVPIDPAILDESCMFEIPSSPALKKGEGYILDKPKSLVSSILLEDLAVSLTIPSPLKSDAHLSFLKPDAFGSVPEDVLSAHFSEDAHLEEEDASEQDIHLALESDNSSSKSSCSSSWTSTPAAPGFQYCPSLPMHAVIMEKSNDHFIVKIRRAAPSTSPVPDQVILAVEPQTSLKERGNHEITPGVKIDTLISKTIALEHATTSMDTVNILDHEGNTSVGKEQVLNLQECVEECLETEPEDAQSGHQQEDPHSHAPDDVLEESLFSHARQKTPYDIPEFLPEPYCNTTENPDPGIPGCHQVLGSDAGSEEVANLQNPKQQEESLKESSSKTIQEQDSPAVFKLPQTQTFKLVQKSDVPCTKERCPSVNSESIPLAEDLSSQSNFDICVDMTKETSMENEVDSWNLTVQSALNATTESLYKDKSEHKIKTGNHCETSHISEHIIETVKSLTENLPGKSAVDENVETKTVLNIRDEGCQISLKESKKRKKETEVMSNAKRHRKESGDLICKKNGKSSKKSKDINSVSTSASSKKTTSVRDKIPLLSAASVSPLSLRAKNIIKRKGEVLISWTRNDDREILLECQKKGPSGETFASVAARLNKSPTQVEERFKQLLKLFKMSNCS